MADLEKWNGHIQSGDPSRVAAAAAKLVAEQRTVSPEFVFTVFDRLWRPVGEIGGDLIEGSGTDVRNAAGSASLKVKGSSTTIAQMMDCREQMVGVTCETAGVRYAYYVKKHSYGYDDGVWTGTVELKGIWDILNHLIIFPLWWMPLAAQPISHAVYFGPIVTVIENMITECALRVQSGIFEFLNGVVSLNLDVRAWFGTLLQSDGNIFEMLKRPIYVVRSNPFLDTSPLVVRTVRMQTVGQVITDLTGPYGIDVAMDLWMPGDPQPDAWANLTRPTYVVRVRDRSGIEGPTKTILDSAIRTVVDLVGSAFGNAVAPLVVQANGIESVFVAPALGVNFREPWVLLEAPEPGRDGSVSSCQIVDHTPSGWNHIVGGRSPKWLNDLINAFLSWMVDAVMIAVGFSGIPSDLLSGFLNNTLLAFQASQHYERRAEVGPYHPAIERFYPTATSPYNVTTFINFIKILYESRGWTSATLVFRNGEIYTLGKDFFRSSLASIVYLGRTRMLTDFVEQIMWRIDANTRDVMVQIGDGRAEEPAIAKHERNITGVMEAVNVLTLAPQS